MDTDGFARDFEVLGGHPPFDWQTALWRSMVGSEIADWPKVVNIPTGLGKTSVIAIYLLAWREIPDRIPRRLVYVVNRRTVVDQTTAEVNRYRQAVGELDQNHPLRDLVERLGISTLRGQFADNHEWSADPSRPAVICGTVDMIGSRLLFGGYRIGYRSRPLHAGFLGQDALLVHDEAHLEPAFQTLIKSIQREQTRERKRSGDLPWPGLHIMSLSATARSNTNDGGKAFGLTDADRAHPVVDRRINATKALQLHQCDNEKELAAQVAGLAAKHKDREAAVLIFVRRIEAVDEVVQQLKSKKHGVSEKAIETLTGTMRGYERDQLVRSSAVFARFLPPADRPPEVTPAEDTVYLVCTSAGEVGVNLSADHMVCDLSTFDSMAQRLGRVNRFGNRDDTRVDVVHPKSFNDNDPLTPARQATLKLLNDLNGNANPKALANLPPDERRAAFAPEPTILPATDILYDAWALTTIRGPMPGRPPVTPYLHGVADWEPPRTSIAWREEVEVITDELLEREGTEFPQKLLADYPLKPHELLSDRTDRVLAELQKLASTHRSTSVWLVDPQHGVHRARLEEIAHPGATNAKAKRPLEEALANNVIVLPPSAGGLSGGMLSADADRANDVADQWLDENNNSRRGRVWDDAPPPTFDDAGSPRPMALLRTIDTDPLAGEFAPPDEESEADDAPGPEACDGRSAKRGRFWHWYARPRDVENVTRASARPIRWRHHTRDVVGEAKRIVSALNWPDQWNELKHAVILATEYHDLGKRREIWQRSIGNPNPTDWHAKPGKPAGAPRWRPRHLSDYRHEFGSLLDVLHTNGEHADKFEKLSDEMRDVVLHLIAAHHGYARPHFTPSAYDHECYNAQQNEEAACEVMRRYARLQRRYGRWGLAYLESLLRAADWAASANPSDGTSEDGDAS